jgi:selenocysteine-specific elongation factor
MDYIIVGTAGHVDHGKTQLVKALTGFYTDRLKEEKERGISIELGFAPVELDNGQRIGLVDVPGHEKFIKQMLAGVGGMDLVMLVVAADEGVMPQTQEHLDIIDLLQIKKGLVVVTKADLVEPDWLELVQEEIRDALQGTVLEDAPMCAVSALTGFGIAELRKELQELAAITPAKVLTGKTRLPIDRVFSISGFGTVVTGTLWSGKVKLGDNLQVLPEGLDTRARSVQVHGKSVEEALAGQRTAINLANVEVSQLKRGSVVVTPGTLHPSHLIDVELKLLNHARELANRTRIRFHVGTSESLGRVVLLDRDVLKPGETTFAQLQLEEVVVSAKGDHFVIRSYSPMHTIGGGTIIEPQGVKLKRFKPEVLAMLQTKLAGTPEELILEELQNSAIPLVNNVQLAKDLSLPPEVLGELVESMVGEGQLFSIAVEGTSWLATQERYQALLSEVKAYLAKYHEQYPLRPGLAKEELRSRKFESYLPKLFNSLLTYWQEGSELSTQGSLVALAGFQPTLSAAEEDQIKKIAEAYLSHKFQPPMWSEFSTSLGVKQQQAGELLRYLVGQGQLVKIDEDLYFHSQAVEEAKDKISSYIKEQGSIQLAQVRDMLGSTRKYVLPLLEYFDQIKFTKRIQDKRILFKS